MSANVEITLTPESIALLARAPAWPRVLMRNVVRALNAENELTITHIKAKRLSRRGPETLGVVTNRLRLSPWVTLATVGGTAINSAIGSNVEYAGAHEYGFEGTVQVKAYRARHHALDVFNIRDRLTYGWELTNLRKGNRKTRVAEGFVTVRAHPMKMNIKERAPFRRGLAERMPNYRESLSAAVVQSFSAP